MPKRGLKEALEQSPTPESILSKKICMAEDCKKEHTGKGSYCSKECLDRDLPFK